MLLSMTGFGEARGVVAGTHVTAELRSVNNRHFKLSLRAPDAWAKFEPEIERVLREQISRGTVTLFLRQDRTAEASAPRLNTAVLAAYWRQLEEVAGELGLDAPPDLAHLLSLPGVTDAGEWAGREGDQVLPELLTLIREAVTKFQEFRVQEGAAMAADLQVQGAVITREVEKITALAPQVAAEYRQKLHQRIQDALAGTGATVETHDLLREVALFTDRADITEELVRLRSHLEQFRQLMAASASQGRKLDFLCQELFRESNTIGSKANHVAVSHAAVELKTAVERMREVVQNVE